MEKKVV